MVIEIYETCFQLYSFSSIGLIYFANSQDRDRDWEELFAQLTYETIHSNENHDVCGKVEAKHLGEFKYFTS